MRESAEFASAEFTRQIKGGKWSFVWKASHVRVMWYCLIFHHVIMFEAFAIFDELLHSGSIHKYCTQSGEIDALCVGVFVRLRRSVQAYTHRTRNWIDFSYWPFHASSAYCGKIRIEHFLYYFNEISNSIYVVCFSFPFLQKKKEKKTRGKI